MGRKQEVLEDIFTYCVETGEFVFDPKDTSTSITLLKKRQYNVVPR